MLPEEKYKLIEEIKAHWKDLSFNMDKYQNLGKESFERNDNFLISDSESSLNDDVFEEDNKKPKNSLDEWTSLYDSLEKLKYLDMFIKVKENFSRIFFKTIITICLKYKMLGAISS